MSREEQEEQIEWTRHTDRPMDVGDICTWGKEVFRVTQRDYTKDTLVLLKIGEGQDVESDTNE